MKGRFRIGDGEITSSESAESIYFSYGELGIDLDKETFDRDVEKYKIFFASQELKNIAFTPKDVKKQDMSDYYFLRLDVKFPRN